MGGTPEARRAALRRQSASADELASPSTWKLPALVNASTDLRCFNCGTAHPNPALRETYRYCLHCRKVLRESSECDTALLSGAPLNQLHILAASYGHPVDPALAIDVTSFVRARLTVMSSTSELYLSADVSELTLVDPAPGVLKVLLLRYVVPNFNPALTRRGDEVYVREVQPQTLATPIQLSFTMDRPPKLWILSGLYGHRTSSTKGMVLDVTERLTAWIDLFGHGCHLCIPSTQTLVDWLGDPCPGLTKALRLHYEVIGRAGQARQYEVDGHLKEDIVIQHLPVVSPGVLLEHADYGWPIQELERKRVELQAQVALGDADAAPLLAQFQALAAASASCDVTAPLQASVRSQLELGARMNLNQLGGDPCPGLPKLLILEYAYLGFGESGNDSEILTGGHLRNFTNRNGGKLKLDVNREGFLKEPVLLQPHTVFPPLQIVRAFFGHPTNALKTYDITDVVATLAGKDKHAKALVVPRTMDLLAQFGDPCRGMRKALTINYKVLGMSGHLAIPATDDNHLVATLELGYPPETRDAGVTGKTSWAERMASRAMTRTTKQTARDRMRSSASLRMWSNESF
ncbi:hypothetical protein SPRG_12045 [Saprolegnia parasitica CBS 223.65]|uniref:Uncharacterized protein n=1 Tax=Saprolegnia parasitica (strain CBS 223.65) TaxID=695850 RepID=A0A067BUV5_SAPPC|nr:hypothetical protein SPRG_12045 [Saprolegnia parasitica CBS 223.65]KDO22058.1 hypothetical protein SPRG_12045 [Saprolegnia parasitica CBS 223.65]|eukprot:XP_012207202.1 hypothetical protein SPRG_12045 [Saprolegnia parasitica CBS 223.65]